MAARSADTVGDGTGNKNAIGDYSSSPQIFKLKPPEGIVYEVNRMLVHVKDSGSFDSGSYGNGITLVNGIEIKQYKGDDAVFDITEGLPILANPDWGRLCYDSMVSNYGSGAETLAARYTFTKDGAPLYLDGSNGGELRVILNDDFSGLLEHYFRFAFNVKKAW